MMKYNRFAKFKPRKKGERNKHSPMKFHISCIPSKTTSQQKRAVSIPGHGIRFFKSKDMVAAESSFAALLHPFRPVAPLDGPLRISITWTWPWRKSEKKANIAMGEMPMTTKPDLANVEKMLVDTMVRLGFMVDDSLIAEEHLFKFWGDTPGISIELEKIVRVDQT